MSGLVAVVGDSTSQDLIRQDLLFMAEAAPHRGTPGSTQTWAGGGAMVQNAEPGHPFTRAGLHREGRFVAATTGCLFEGSGVVGGDEAAQRIGDAYVSHGPSAIRELRGSFAAVVVDIRDDLVFAARSPMGERPLFWRRQGTSIAFASEVKQLRVKEPAPPDDEAAMTAVNNAPLDRSRTMFVGIHRVPAGTWLRLGGAEQSSGTLWEPATSVGSAGIRPEDAVREFRRLMRVAVARRMAPDTVVLVSGGLDSTPVAVEASEFHRERFGEPLTAVSAIYPEHPRVDESAYVSELAEALPLRMQWARPGPHVVEDMDGRIRFHDGPALPPMEQNFNRVLDAVRETGARSALDGHDGDSVLGYPTGLVRALARRGSFLCWARFVRFARDRQRLGWPRALLRHGIAPVLPPAFLGAYGRVRGGASSPGLSEWVQEPLRSSLESETGRKDGRPNWFGEEVARVEGGNLEKALEALERQALAKGLTILHPLADRDLVEFLLSLPPEVKFADGRMKSLVRMGYPEIPASIRNRSDKTVFTDLVIAGPGGDEILAMITAGPRRLPGVDWDRLEAHVLEGAPDFEELSLIRRVVQADHFLGL